MKRIFALALALGMVLSLVGCSKTQPEEETVTEINWDIAPTIIIGDRSYNAPGMPVSELPEGYDYIGDLSEEAAYNTGLAGTPMYAERSENFVDFYLYQECGTPVSEDTVDNTQLQMAYVHWISLDWEEPVQEEETSEEIEEETEEPFVRAIRVFGDLYYDTGETDDSLRCGNMDGQITSSTEGAIPEEDGESNFGIGYGYQFWDDTIQVYLPEEQVWEVFRKDPDAPDGWGLTLTAEDVTATGLTLTFTQTGGTVTGALQTGAAYWLETETETGWEYVEPLDGEDICWSDVALSPGTECTTQYEVDWSELYGTLPAGHYRIGKNVMQCHDDTNWDNKTYYAEFDVGTWQSEMKK
jgi:hypothetical protein